MTLWIQKKNFYSSLYSYYTLGNVKTYRLLKRPYPFDQFDHFNFLLLAYES